MSETDKVRDESRVNSGFGKNVSNWIGRDKVYPTNVIHLATETSNKNHSAAFPEDLPAWFIKLFTNQNDLVLDPFLGSGTTAVAAKRLGRRYVGIDINQKFYTLSKKRLQQVQPILFDEHTIQENDTGNISSSLINLGSILTTMGDLFKRKWYIKPQI